MCDEVIKAFPRHKNKKKYFNGWLIFVIVILSAFLLVESIILGMEIFRQRNVLIGSVPLGTEATISLGNSGAYATAITYDGSNIPGAKVIQNVKIFLPLESENSVVRARVFSCDEGGNATEIQIAVADIWTQQGIYYYYNDVLESGVTTNFIQKIVLPTEEDFFNADKYYEIIVLVETLSYESLNYSYLDVWQDTPNDWLINLSN